LAAECHERNVRVVVNGTQAVGAVPVDVGSLGIDALSASGFKWLCGPYATGFAWLSPTLRDMLEPIQSYWLAQPDGAAIDLGAQTEPQLRDDLGARGYDVFGTANFFNFAPWLASLELLLGHGPDVIAEHDALLVATLVDGLRERGCRVLTPAEPAARAAIVSFDGATEPAEVTVARLARAGVDVAARGGHVRVSPHLHNTIGDIERLLAALTEPRP
jgi:selenocysteine lyase/cysteine desulfurase